MTMQIFADQFDLIDTIARYAQTDRDAVWQGLLVGLVLTVIYLTTLLTTRWGERNALIKACVFSVMIHVFSTLGWVAVAEPGRRESEISVAEEPETFEVVVMAEETFDIAQTGDTPVWNRLPKPAETQLARAEPVRDPLEFEPVDRNEAQQPTESPDVADITPLPEATTDNPAADRTIDERIANTVPTPLDVPKPLQDDRQPQTTPTQRPRTLPNNTNKVAADTQRQPENVMASVDPRDIRLPDLPNNTNADVPQPLSPFVDPKLSRPTGPNVTEAPQQVPIANVPAVLPQRKRDPVNRQPGIETGVDRQPRAGVSNNVARDVDPSERVMALKSENDPRALLKSSRPEDNIIRRSSPVPAPGPQPELGVLEGAGSERIARGVPDLTPARSRPDDRRATISGAPQRTRTMPAGGTPPVTPPRSVDIAAAPSVPSPSAGLPRPQVIRPKQQRGMLARKVALPSAYSYRGPEQRKLAALNYGGTKGSEDAVEMALQWLAANQHPQGYWDASAHGAGNVRVDERNLDTRGAEVKEVIPGTRADAGVTALALLAFLGAGQTQDEGDYTDNVGRAVTWLVKQQRDDGFLGGNASHYARMYSHAMATYALAEAYGMRNSKYVTSEIRESLRKAVAYILAMQSPEDGGWRYVRGTRSDMSIFGWNLMALKSAEIAGIKVPSEAKDLMIDFLRKRSLGKNSGLAAYHVDTKVAQTEPTATMTAEALFCKQMLGLPRQHPSSAEAIEFLQQHLPTRSEYDVYYWYYGTLAVYQYGGNTWTVWNNRLRDMLVTDQRLTGPLRGSWDPKGRWGGYGGRVYSTAMSALCLEVYYRFLPLYKSELRSENE